MPLLAQEAVDIDSKELTKPQIEQQMLNLQLSIEHEMFRKENWEHLKHFRSKYDNEYHLSESIMETSEINTKKKDFDKLILNAIRMCIVSEETEKVFSYMDMLNFSQSLKLVVKLCE